MAVTTHTSVARTISTSAVAVAASVAVPFLVHLLPGGSSIGTTLLPIFWAPVLAIVFFGPVPAVAAALLAPMLNRLLTGMPPAFVLPTLSVELVIFAMLLVLATGTRSLARSPLVAPLAYLIAHVATGLLFVAFGSSGATTIAAVFAGLGTAVPGLIALLVINGVGVLATRKAR